MRKLICLFVAIIMASTAFSACEWKFAKTEESSTATTTSSTSTTSTIMDPSVEELVFEYGDDFTQDDVEFVKSLHAVNYNVMYDLPSYTFSDVVNEIIAGKGSLYYASLDLDNPYYICGYLDLDIEANRHSWEVSAIDVTIYKWYKFYSSEEIPEIIEGLEHGWSFLIYDCTIHREMGGATSYEHSCKYFTQYRGEKYLETVYENMLMFYTNSAYPNIFDTKFLEENRCRVTRYEVIINSDGVEYLRLYPNTHYEDGTIKSSENSNRKYLGEYYDALEPLIQRLEGFDYEGIDSNAEKVTYLALGIPIDLIAETVLR